MALIPVLYSRTVTITSAQFKSIFTTPIQIIAAPGAGKIISILMATIKFNYGGSNVFVTGGNLGLWATNISGLRFININQALYTGSVDNFYAMTGSQTASAGLLENQAVVLSVGTSDPTGNAANDNSLVVNVLYEILTM